MDNQCYYLENTFLILIAYYSPILETARGDLFVPGFTRYVLYYSSAPFKLFIQLFKTISVCNRVLSRNAA